MLLKGSDYCSIQELLIGSPGLGIRQEKWPKGKVAVCVQLQVPAVLEDGWED